MQMRRKLLEDWMSLIREQKAQIKAMPIDENKHWGEWIANLIKRTQEHLDSGDEISPYNPPHGKFDKNCCGIFTVINDDGILSCNECGMTINDLIEPLSL